MDQENGPTMKESDSVEPGTEILPPFDTVLGKIGSAICFDLRFAELALHNKRNGATVLVYPSAFHPDTGAVHWKPLLQARAIESLCYVIAAGQVGVHNEKRSSWGHSLVISPWGEVLQEASGEWHGEPEVLIADIDQGLVEEKRKGLPQARRT
jgi:predicted amidohydrolase